MHSQLASADSQVCHRHNGDGAHQDRLGVRSRSLPRTNTRTALTVVGDYATVAALSVIIKYVICKYLFQTYASTLDI